MAEIAVDQNDIRTAAAEVTAAADLIGHAADARAADLAVSGQTGWSAVAQTRSAGSGGGAVHGEEPTDPSFGDNRYVIDTSGHSAYWAPTSVSLDNQASIVVGQYNQVSLEYGSPPTR